ncbi:MAG: DUF4252 domain-containing protein [Flavobacteriales bacterium]|nr:DUF4252 domain-containing protein [Flavobacteriales bacterium]
MKLIKILFLAAFFFTISTIQVRAGNDTKTFSDFYKNHQHKESVSLNIPGFFVRFLLDKEDDAKEISKDIKHVKLLIFEGHASSQKELADELNQYLPSNLYNDLMIIKDGADQVTFKLREKKGKINEIIMIATDNSSSVILCIEGNMELSDVKKLVKSITLMT